MVLHGFLNRPCAMVVPDFELIAEIMLVAEGFLEARLLARKFLTLYSLCKELLSKQDHYDWGLRAIKSVLVVAGSLKRSDPDRPEDQVHKDSFSNLILCKQLSCFEVCVILECTESANLSKMVRSSYANVDECTNMCGSELMSIAVYNSKIIFY